MLIATSTLAKDMLKDEVAIVTGGGQGHRPGSGPEACFGSGPESIIAEIDEDTGRKTAAELVEEFGHGRVTFVKTDVGDEGDVKRLKQAALAEFGKSGHRPE